MNLCRRITALIGAVLFAATVYGAPLEAPTKTGFVVGETVSKRPIKCDVYGKGDDVLWIIATIHGNEAAGTPLVAKFVEWLKAHPKELEGRTVVITPVANPDGMADNVRYNKHGVDLNRNFPAGNWNTAGEKSPGSTPLSEPESRSLMRVLCQFFPNRIVSIHQPLTCLDYDGPAEGLAKAMGAKCKLPVKKLGSRPGSLGSFVGVTLGKPIVTMELPENAGMDGDKVWKEYGEALIAALQYKEPEAKQ
jgi:protein MpaA